MKTTKNSKIKCDKNKFKLVESNWNYGYWDISNTSEIGFHKKDKTYINSVTNIKIKDFIFISFNNLSPYSAATMSLLNSELDIPMGIGFIFSILPKIGSTNKKKAK